MSEDCHTSNNQNAGLLSNRPVTCTVGDSYVAIDVMNTLYRCTALNTWTAETWETREPIKVPKTESVLPRIANDVVSEAMNKFYAQDATAQEAPRERCPACGSSFKSVRQFAYSTDRTSRAPCGDKWHEPQAGAQVPSQDEIREKLKDSSVVHVGILRGDIALTKAQAIHIAGLPADIEDRLARVVSYAEEAQKTPITREDMHDPMKAQTFFDETEGFWRLVKSEIGG